MTAKSREQEQRKPSSAARERPARDKAPVKDKAAENSVDQLRRDEDRLPVNPYPLNQESDRPGAPFPPETVPPAGGPRNR